MFQNLDKLHRFYLMKENGVANMRVFRHQSMSFTEPSTGSSVFGGFGVDFVVGLTNFDQESLSLSAFFFFSPFPLPFLPPDDMISIWHAIWLPDSSYIRLRTGLKLVGMLCIQ